MNTPDPYERRRDRTLPEPAPAPDAEKAVDALAVHRDPSVPTAEATQETERSQPGVAWVRPSEIPTLLGSKFVRRGIDLQAELTRRARRTPGTAVSKASRRISRTSIARPDSASPSITSQEGLGL
ncbi:hypothetical protein GCM10011584_04070 [Nocardioides phosphati]|uniref:Uncharacterized protein n=1 Tax=Nocardioides phosphati TaxID=1867775 RepID=A0ABQ2N7M4_9ACTN|nr:hypothetical protein [Nocardioides phosphati]GGO85051.1 hypothetical protein GCM10011584_04070 [Nocardioides phosphati]